MARLARLTLFLATALTLASCEASESDLVGTWVPDEWSQERLEEAHGARISPRLTLAGNGIFTAVEVPMETGSLFSIPRPEALMTCTGEWELRRFRDLAASPSLRLRAESCEPGHHKPPPFVASLVAQKEFLGGHILVHYRGDPDTGDAIYFERVPGTR